MEEKGAESKTQMIKTAERLFSEKGFDDTSIDDICEEVGVAHGLFYYYFDSKEDMMRSVTQKMVEQIEDELRSIAEDDDLAADEKFMKFIRVSFEKKKGKPYVYSFFSEEKNLRLYQRLYYESVDMMTPYLTQIIQQGIDEGIFETEHPEETVRFWLHGLMFARDGDDFFREDFTEKLQALSSITVRLFGSEKDIFSPFFDSYEDEIEDLVEETRREY